MNDEMKKEEMNLKEALNCAYWTMKQELDYIQEELDKHDKQYLKISEADLIEAIRVLDEHMRMM